MPPVNAADRARTAHRILRLRESGVANDRALADLARAELLRRTANPDEADEQIIRAGGPRLEALTGFALHVQNLLEGDAPGPTDPKLVGRLFDRPKLGDVWREWEDAVVANLGEHHPEDLKRAQRAWAKDAKGHEERTAALTETGDWPVHPAFGHDRHEEGAANALYDLGREGFLAGAIDFNTAVFKLILVDSADYVVNLATHQFLSSVAAAGREETSAALANKTVAAGVADADDLNPTFPGAAGDPCEALILVQSSAVGGGADVADTAQRLVVYWDTATGLPVTLNGGAINVVHDSGANRIFKL